DPFQLRGDVITGEAFAVGSGQAAVEFLRRQRLDMSPRARGLRARPHRRQREREAEQRKEKSLRHDSITSYLRLLWGIDARRRVPDRVDDHASIVPSGDGTGRPSKPSV